MPRDARLRVLLLWVGRIRRVGRSVRQDRTIAMVGATDLGYRQHILYQFSNPSNVASFSGGITPWCLRWKCHREHFVKNECPKLLR